MADQEGKFVEQLATWFFHRAQKSYVRKSVEAAEQSGARLGLLLYRLDKKHRLRTLANLELAYPEKTAAEREAIAKGVFQHFGRVFADFMRSPARTNEEVLAGMEVEGEENLWTAVNADRGVIAVCGHFGNWERFAHWMTARGGKLSVVARDANQRGIQDELAKMRESVGVEVLSRGNAARQILSKLRKKETIAVLPDQNSEECFVPFFGKPCGTVMGPAVLHIRTGAYIIPAYCARIGPGKYRAICMAPIDPDCLENDPEVISAQVNASLEKVVREYPEQWLWMHDRWKSARRKGLL